ncbi:MAG: hypothetical protein AB8B87_19635 [Granulosicoccus sp.]
MSYTARQLHCLEAMGLVAWVSGESPEVEQQLAPQAPDNALRQAQGSPDRSTEPSGVAIPAAIDQLSQWLVRQPLTRLMYKGTQTSSIGSEQASLLVVCVHTQESSQLPLSRESAQLFDLMMRAIDVQRTGFRQCAMPTQLSTQVQDSKAILYLEDVVTPQCRVVLVLDPLWGPSAVAGEPGKSVLPSSSVPFWRVPHPDLLLANPALKREAWEALKAMQQVLG